MRDKRGANKVLLAKPERERDHSEDLRIVRRIIIRWIFRKWDGEGHELD
jgi:hypothetical protein